MEKTVWEHWTATPAGNFKIRVEENGDMVLAIRGSNLLRQELRIPKRMIPRSLETLYATCDD